MKIALPVNKIDEEFQVALHFGRCSHYFFLDEEGNKIGEIENTSDHIDEAELPPQTINRMGAKVLLCRDLGPKALDLCRELGIKVYCSESENVKEFFDLWKNNKLKEAAQDCQNHL